jgi:hypothetical protein
MTIYLSLIVSLIGVFIYILSANPKVARIGEIMFACGLLAFLLMLGGGNVSIGK